jgi:hypothetical protein
MSCMESVLEVALSLTSVYTHQIVQTLKFQFLNGTSDKEDRKI